MDNVNVIITAKDYSRIEGADGSVIGRLQKMQQRGRARNRFVKIEFDVRGKALNAEINQGAWVAMCECGGVEFVDPDEPIFFCWDCVNRSNGGHVRPVLFPENRQEIEAAVLEREVDDVRGITDADRAFSARPLVSILDDKGNLYPATRSWVPGESAEQLREQNKFIANAIKNRSE